MQKEMESLRSQARASFSKDSFATPPPKIPAPSPGLRKEKKGLNAHPGPPAPPPPPPQGLVAVDSQPPPTSEGAKLQRLRRLCEKKPSGKCFVPEEVHKRWATGGKAEREAMIEEFEKANWSKDFLE